MRRKQDCRPYAGRRRPVWRRAAALLLLAALVAFGVLEAVVLSGGRTQIQGQPEIMVIFGCQVKPDGPSALLRDRLDTALDYLECHPISLWWSPAGRGTTNMCPRPNVCTII